jgi:hypothetical protein
MPLDLRYGRLDRGPVGLAASPAWLQVLQDIARHHVFVDIRLDDADPLLHAGQCNRAGGLQGGSVESRIDVARDRARFVQLQFPVLHGRHFVVRVPRFAIGVATMIGLLDPVLDALFLADKHRRPRVCRGVESIE